jgi:hypothetical protein
MPVNQEGESLMFSERATMSSTVNAALVEYLEAAALEAYRRWDAEADADERAALDALAADDDRSWAGE